MGDLDNQKETHIRFLSRRVSKDLRAESKKKKHQDFPQEKTSAGQPHTSRGKAGMWEHSKEGNQRERGKHRPRKLCNTCGETDAHPLKLQRGSVKGSGEDPRRHDMRTQKQEGGSKKNFRRLRKKIIQILHDSQKGSRSKGGY